MSISEFDKMSLIANYCDDVSWDARIAEPDFGQLLLDLKEDDFCGDGCLFFDRAHAYFLSQKTEKDYASNYPVLSPEKMRPVIVEYLNSDFSNDDGLREEKYMLFLSVMDQDLKQRFQNKDQEKLLHFPFIRSLAGMYHLQAQIEDLPLFKKQIILPESDRDLAKQALSKTNTNLKNFEIEYMSNLLHATPLDGQPVKTGVQDNCPSKILSAAAMMMTRYAQADENNDLKQKERLRCILSSTVPGVLYEANRSGDIRSVKDVEDVLIKFMNQSNMTASAQACECQFNKKSSWRHVRMLPDLVMTNSYE